MQTQETNDYAIYKRCVAKLVWNNSCAKEILLNIDPGINVTAVNDELCSQHVGRPIHFVLSSCHTRYNVARSQSTVRISKSYILHIIYTLLGYLVQRVSC